MIFKKEQNRILFLLFSQVLVIVTLLTSCGKNAPEFATKEEIAKKAVELLNNGDSKSLSKILVRKEEYINDYYPYFPEAKYKNALSGEEFYGMFVSFQRINAIQFKSRKYKDRIISIIEIGEPEKLIQTEAFTIHRKTPLRLLVKNDKGNEIEIIDNKILGAVVEKNNRYKLMSVFK